MQDCQLNCTRPKVNTGNQPAKICVLNGQFSMHKEDGLSIFAGGNGEGLAQPQLYAQTGCHGALAAGRQDMVVIGLEPTSNSAGFLYAYDVNAGIMKLLVKACSASTMLSSPGELLIEMVQSQNVD